MEALLDDGVQWHNQANTTEPSVCGSDQRCGRMSNYFHHLLLIILEADINYAIPKRCKVIYQ